MSAVISFESVVGLKTTEDIVKGLVYLAMTGGRSWSNGISKVKLWEKKKIGSICIQNCGMLDKRVWI